MGGKEKPDQTDIRKEEIVLSKEKINTKTLITAIEAQKVGAETALEKATVHFLEELKQYRDLEEQGLLLRLPCKVGDTVYYIENNTDACTDCPHYSDFYGMDSMCSKTKYNTIYEPRWENIPICDKQFLEITEMKVNLRSIISHLDDFGKTIFFTQSEAEEKLKELELNDPSKMVHRSTEAEKLGCSENGYKKCLLKHTDLLSKQRED